MSKDDKIYNQYHTNTLETLEAFFSGHAYDSHRHDTFAVGLTLSGIQSFHYGGCVQHNIPGSTMVLYPDEKHDGMAGTHAGFHYKMVYIKPELIQQILRGSSLHFIKNGISQHPILFQKVKNLLSCLSPNYRNELEEEDAFYEFVMVLRDISGGLQKGKQPLDYSMAERAREYIHCSLQETISLADIEQNIGCDRWSISRHFRGIFGTSPHRYIIMRRLDQVKLFLLLKKPLAEAAIMAGFFDQSHMTKHFKKTFGITPLHWQSIVNRL